MKLEDNENLSTALGQMIIVWLGLKPDEEVMAFNSVGWLESGELGEELKGNALQLRKIVSKLWKSAPKNTVVPQEVVNVMAMLKTLHGPQQMEIENTVSPTGPPAAATGGALPPAAPTPWQELLKEYSSDEQLRQFDQRSRAIIAGQHWQAW